ncbi:uncharacterized protein LOC111705548 [Eurytemora carolleeae]|uniref:uncharacterized protein LOC111705548 n=1 Tax=Eurytemora carolleeae TaxID=1294199 RepID=UPI000C78832D|nr:uncharacterized protein LOC111705548 [Eurytemora carolleeae]|eukprot:XP_023333902.1 uncharacterized protein LOC111705548 [Eurytemora affinis]
MQDGVTSTGYYDMPHPEFLIRTVIRNGSDLLKGGVDIQSFKEDMEERLTRTYRQAYSTLERRRRSIHFREKRSDAEKVRVRIHNIRSALPEPEIEILYTVYENDEQPVLAAEAVKRVDANVDNDDAVLLLGHPLKIKAEPYMKKFEVASPRASKDWLIASVILAVFLALLLIWLLVIVYRQYWRKKQKHSILESISSNSKGNSPSAPRKSPTPSQFVEGGGFTLDRPRPQTNLILETSDPFNEHHQKSGISTENITKGRVRLASYESDERGNKSDGEGMADHSSNNTPDPGKRNKKGGKKREKRRRKGGGLSTSEEEYSDSAFPVKTPENLKVLDDLLEEDLPLPGESGRGNLHPGNPGWAYLPDSPDLNWEETARRVQEEARKYEVIHH